MAGAVDTTRAKFRQDHPNFRNILQLVNECNAIKYAAYRTAAKLRVLQRALHMETVRLRVVAGVFERHHLQATENGVNLELRELEAVIFDIFFAAQKESLARIDVDLITELMLNLLLNVYKSSGSLQVLSVKVTLTVLSAATLQEKCHYLFSQLADHNNCISSNRFELLLHNLARLTEFVSESTAFGCQQVPSSVEKCFQQSHGTLGVTEDMFVSWLVHEPQLLVWLSIMYRMQAAEPVRHGVKCGVCKVCPITGLRYRCLDCLCYNQCQACFLSGQVSKRHKLRHRMQEYCCQTSSRETTLAFLKMLKNKLCGNSTKLQYFSVQPYDIVFESSGQDIVLVPSGQDETEVQPQSELQSIIASLDEENRHLQLVLDKLSGREETRNCLRDHHALLQAQIERLKKLQAHFLRRRPPRNLHSTPLVPANQRHSEISSLDDISPIIRETSGAGKLRQLQLLTWQMRQETHSIGESAKVNDDFTPMLPALTDVSLSDISTWVGGRAVATEPSGFSTWVQEPGPSRPKPSHEDLNGILERLQEMLASSFSLEESFSSSDNAQLQQGAKEVEDLLTRLIKGVESRKTED